MDRKLALVVLSVLLVCGGAWWVTRGTGEGRGARAPAPSAPDRGAGAEAPDVPELVRAEAPADAQRTTARPSEPVPAPESLPLEHQTFALDGARWLEVTVRLPAGRPREDQPALIGFARRYGAPFEDWNGREIGEALGLDDAFAAEVEDDHHWARRALAERVHMPFPADASEGLLLLQSRYLHLDPLEVSLQTTSSLTLEPELGGYVTGRFVFPPGRAAAPGDIELELGGREPGEGLMGFARPDARAARVRPDLGFELRALSARRKYAVQARAEGFVGHFELSFEIAPGEHRELEIPFRLGASVAGVVRGDGQPLSGARVEARVRGALPWHDAVGAETGADGAFLLQGVPGGKVRLQAEKDGWLEAESEMLTLVEGQELREIELVLAPGERVGGTLRWPDGTGVEGAEVKAFKEGERWMQPLTETRSGADGSFVLGGLEEGPVEVFAQDEPAERPSRGGSAASAPETGPGELALEAERWIAVASAVALGTRDLVLTLQPPLPVRGTVVDDTGAPVRSFDVAARPALRPSNAPEETRRDFDAPDGAFTLVVGLPGEWVFTAHAREGEGQSEEVSLAVPQGGELLRLVLPRASSVSGQVVDPQGRPVAGARILVTDDPRAEAFLFLAEGSATSDSVGRFTLSSVKRGSSVRATHEDWAASETTALELAPGETRTDLLLALRLGARVTGEVFDADGEPEAGQNVNCASGAMAAMAFGFGGEASTVTDSGGRFAFEHVTPGKLTISAMPAEEELLARFQEGDADETAFLSMLSDMRTATVEVADGGEAHVVLGAKKKRPVRVHGRVTEAGIPLADKQVLVFAEGGALLHGMKLARTDAAGRYEVVLDRPGDYVFGVSLREGMEGAGTPFYVDVPEVEALEQDLALPLGRIAGVVLGPDGPAAGVSLRLVSGEGMLGLDDLSEAQRARSASDGSFGFEHLRSGAYALQVGSDFEGNSDAYGQLVVDGLRLEPDRAIEGLVVRLQKPGKLSGVVRDANGAPAGGVAIFVRDAAGRAISTSGCTSDAAGRFTYAGIAPGRVTASAKGARLAGPESATVEIQSGETSHVELSVAPGTFLRVSLLDGEKEVRARLRVLDEAGRRVDDLFAFEDLAALLSEGFSSRTRRVGPLAPGKYTLVATSLDGKDAKKSVMIEAGQEERIVKLRLK